MLAWKPSQGTKLYCLVNRGTLLSTTCPRLLLDNATAGNWTHSWQSPAERESSALTTALPSHQFCGCLLWFSVTKVCDGAVGRFDIACSMVNFFMCVCLNNLIGRVFQPDLHFTAFNGPTPTLSVQKSMSHIVHTEVMHQLNRPQRRLCLPDFHLYCKYYVWSSVSVSQQHHPGCLFNSRLQLHLLFTLAFKYCSMTYF